MAAKKNQTRSLEQRKKIAAEDRFNLIITKEISRFVRNTPDSCSRMRAVRSCLLSVAEEIWDKANKVLKRS